MKTTDVYYANLIMKLLGISKTEAGYYLGGTWKSWSKFTTNRLIALLDKRIDDLHREGSEFTSIRNLVTQMRACRVRLIEARDFEENLVRRLQVKRMTLQDMRDLCMDNELLPANLQRSMRSQGWKRTKDKGKVFFVKGETRK